MIINLSVSLHFIVYGREPLQCVVIQSIPLVHIENAHITESQVHVFPVTLLALLQPVCTLKHTEGLEQHEEKKMNEEESI